MTKTDNVINYTAVKITAADRVKLSSETFVQGFAKTCSLDDRYEAFFSLSLIEAKFVILGLNKDLFCWSQHCAIPHNFPPLAIGLFYRTICPPNPAQFNFFPAPCQMPCNKGKTRTRLACENIVTLLDLGS